METKEIEEYKSKRLKELELPSGLKVTIKEATPYTLLRIEEELGIKPDAEEFYSRKLVDRLFQECVVSPKIPDELSIDDLEREDFLFLHKKIFNDVTYEVPK